MRDSLRNLWAGLCVGLLLTAAAAAQENQNQDNPQEVGKPPQWIWIEGETGDDQTVYLRREFRVARGRVEAARLIVTGDDAVEVFLNGESLLKDDNWETPAFRDIARLVREGRNEFAIKATNKDGPAGVLVQLHLEVGRRRRVNVDIVSDGTWLASPEAPDGWTAPDFDDSKWKRAAAVAALGEGKWKELTADRFLAAAKLRQPTATPVAQIKALKGFNVELLYSVPQDQEGSWVNMCVDPKGRLIVSDQYGRLYRIAPPEAGQALAADAVQPLDLDIGEAQGLLWAFDSLYVVVNKGGQYESGLYRVTDSDADGELDNVDLLRRIDGGGEHGPHAVVLSPDGRSLYIVCGNNTRLPEIDVSRVPRVWDEDILLPRLYGKGFMRGVPAPGGFIAKTDPEGKTWELIATGFRNEFDAAFNRDGELFAYDADMEWDFNTPWYRPTRICHVVSGADFGWRNGSGKWRVSYPDSLPAAVDIGPGSPTGVCFGYGAKFPRKYENALFACDWSYGKLYAVHLEAEGSSYGGTFEEFISGTPLPLTDVVVNPHDGALYFTIGGRKVQSGLYRVTFQAAPGEAALAQKGQPVDQSKRLASDELRKPRRELEALHAPSEGSLETIWEFLRIPEDRFLQYAARIALEHQPVEQWRDRALKERSPNTSLTALLALVRQQKRAPSLRNDIHDPVVPTYPCELDLTGVDLELKGRLLARLGQFDWERLNPEQRIALLRIYTVLLCRMGPPDEVTREKLIARLDAMYPAPAKELNASLCELLVYLQAPNAAAKSVALLEAAPTQEEQIDYAKSLRFLRTGWNDELLRGYFGWFVKAAGYRGGANFGMFMDDIRKDALALLSAEQKLAMQDLLDAAAKPAQPAVAAAPRPVVKAWTMDDVLPLVEAGLHDRDFERGRRLFGEARCFTCHRFDNDGGAMGPDLTSLAGRFSRRDILEAVLDPGKVVSDQYAAVQVVTTDGNVVVGRIVNLSGDTMQINTDMADPNALTQVNRREIEEMQPSKVSMMPKGLLDTLHEDEVLDLMAYLLSRGLRESDMFALAGAGDADNVAVDAQLAPGIQEQPPEGFRALFNGTDITGWHGMPGGDPRELAKLPEEERKAKIDEWTADAKQHWSVENGELVNDGHGAYLTTDEEFSDYELLIDYKTVALADSGIYLKYTPQVQIWDFTEAGGKWELGADKGSGGLWNNSPGTPGKDPLVLADKPFGEWNSFRIRQVGARTSIWLNGQLVVDHAILENFFEKRAPSDADAPKNLVTAKPLFKKGAIELQTHGGEIRWRNIFLREIPPDEANRILKEKSGEGFTALFNGTDLTGWKGAAENYEVVDGAIRCKDGHGGVLHTENEYSDFRVRLEFKLPAGGNNGLAIRYPGEGDPAYAGMCELQVLDSEHDNYRDRLDPRQAHGSAYGMVPAARGYLRPTGEWNFQQVTVQGSKLKVELNGYVILDCDLSTVTEYMANSPHPGKERTKGYFGFAGHSDPVMFRAVEIKPLDAPAAATWPQFRGPGSAGRPLVDAPLPEKIDPQSNVVWKVELPPGHSSPVIHGDRLYLTAVRDNRLLTLGLDRNTGAVLWEQEAPHESLEELHTIGSYAQSSAATDGEHVVSFFGSSGLFCYDRDSNFLWSRPMGPFKNGFGAGSSPIIVDGRVILSQDHDSGSFIAAYNLENGSTLWETDRSEFPRNYCTPLIWEVDGKMQIVVAATLRVIGYDFDTGKELWTVRGLSRTVCTTPVVAEDGILYLAAWSAGADPGSRIIFPPFETKRDEIDADKNGRIELAELEAEKGSDLERRFDLLDRNKDKSITKEEYDEFRNVLETAQNVVLAIRPGGEGDVTATHVLWRHQKFVPFCASPVVAGGCVFGVKDGGILTTLDIASGSELKTARVAGNGNYYASPVAADGRVFLIDQNGELTIVKAAGDWEELSSADFGEQVYATPAIVDGRMYVRTVGHLYCFGG